MINISTSDAGEAIVTPAQIILTPDNWGDPRVVTVTGVADLLVDGTAPLQLSFTVDDDLSDPEFAVLATQQVDVNVTNADVPGFRYSHTGGNTTISEFGASDTFTVELTARPEFDVVIGLLAADGTEMSISRRYLTFTPGNWSIPQTVTVTGRDDFLIDGDIDTFVTLAVEDHLSSPAYSVVPGQSVPVRNVDDDHAGLIISHTDAIVDEAGTIDTVFVSLSSQPRSNVVITLQSSDTGEVNVSPTTLNFLPGRWRIPQAVTLTPVSDLTNDGNQTSTVTLSVDPQASDDDFDSLGDQIITVTSLDNDLSRVVGPVGTIYDPRPTITLTSVDNADAYEIWLEKIGAAGNPVVNPTITTTTYVLPEDLPAGRYRTWARARRTGGATTSWHQVVFTVSLRPELELLPQPSTPLRPVLQWAPVPGASSYRVYGSNLTSGDLGAVDEITTATQFSPGSDLGLGRHRFWVQARGTGFQAWSSLVDFVVGPQPTPAITSSINVRPTLEWQNVPETASVRLYVTGPSGVVLDARGLTSNSFTLPFDLDVGRHRWWLQPTHNSGRVGEWSSAGEVFVGGQPQILSPGGTDMTGSPAFTWTPVDDAASYEVYFYHVQTRQVVHRQTGLQQPRWTSFPVADGHYRFWVRAHDEDNVAALWSRAHDVRVQAATAPNSTTPAGPLGPTFDRTPTFTWDSDGPAVSYDLQIWNDVQTLAQSDLTTANWTPDVDLAAGPWRWAVRSRSADGVGPWAFAETDTSARPQLYSPVGNVASKPLFAWSTVDAATGYHLYIDNLTTGESGVVSEQLTTNTWTPSSPLAAASYRVWVRALRDGGPPSPWSIQQDFVVVDATSAQPDDDDSFALAADRLEHRRTQRTGSPAGSLTDAHHAANPAAPADHQRPQHTVAIPSGRATEASMQPPTASQRGEHNEADAALLDQLMQVPANWRLLDTHC